MTVYPSDSGLLTGTPDKDYNILWFSEACLRNVLRLDQYVADAKQLLARRLAAV